MPPATVRQATRQNLIYDLQTLHSATPVTRDLYRERGEFSEREWQQVFPSFKAFLDAAGVPSRNHAPNQNKPTSGYSSSEPAPRGFSNAETSEVRGDTWDITIPRTRIHTLEQLLEYCEVDLQVWEVERCTVNKWEVGAIDHCSPNKLTAILTEQLFQVKATLRRRKAMVAVRAELEAMKEDARFDAPDPRYEVGCIVQRFSGNLLEVNIPDAHFGKLAWGAETGYENYDTVIAEQMFMRALDALMERTSGYKFEEVLFVVGNDLLNSDDLDGRTTKGTFVSTDGRYQKTFAVVRRTITQAIERLRTIAPVKVVMVSGNHDDLSVWHLGDSLECWFAKYTDVEIDNEPLTRKYHEFGQAMLMFTHGDKGRRLDYPLLMATEQPEMFGRTIFREAHTGHTHQTKMEEQHGVRVRVLPALCPPDAWHAENGFVGNLRSAEAYVWNRDEGLVAQVYYNDNAHPAIETRCALQAA